MSPWKPLLACCCLLLAPAAPAKAAAIPFRGLDVSAAGACAVAPTADGRLQLSNLGSSGQDGVDLAISNLDGARVRLSVTARDADAGATVSFAFQYRVGATSTVRGELLQCAVLPGRVDFTPTLAPVVAAASTGQTARVRMRLTLTTDVVYDGTLAPGSSASLRRAAGVACPVGTLSCYLDRATRTECCAVQLPSVQTCVVNGVDVACDGIVFSADFDAASDGLGQDASLRVAAPPGSALSSVALDGVDAVALQHFVSGLGQPSLQGSLVSGQRRLRLHNLGSSGQDGVALDALPGHGVQYSPTWTRLSCAADLRFAHPSLAWTAPGDDGAASVTHVYGRSSVTASGLLASQAITMQGGAFSMRCDFSGIGADAESVVVTNQGVEMARLGLALGASVLVQPAADGPLGMAINEKGLPGDKPRTRGATVRPPAGVDYHRVQPAGALASGPPDELPFVLGFRTPRVFVVGGQSVTGDRIFCWGLRSADSTGTVRVESQDEMVTTGSGAASQHDLDVLDIVTATTNQVSVEVPPSTALSGAHTCVRAALKLHQAEVLRTQAFSLRFHLSPELAACGVGVSEGDYLSRFGSTQVFVHDNGGGSYTVDCSLLGPVCSVEGDGTLVSVEVSAVQPATTGTGVITVDDVRLRDCTNLALPVTAGAPGYVPIDFVSPPAPAGLAAAQVTTGNPPGGTTGVALSWSPPDELDAAVEVYRKGFGNYPFYDRGSSAGTVPSPPSTPAAALASGWSLATCRAPGDVDTPASRDFEYYCAFVRDVFGNTSAASALSNGALDYHLGDVSDGVTTCAGDDRVSIADVSFLGAHYGQAVPPGSAFACLDVGPTTDFSAGARPAPDGRVEFEDFMLFALNWSVVSAPPSGRAPSPAPANAARLALPLAGGPGSAFEVGVNVDAAGDAQAFSVRLDYDPAVLEPVGVTAGALLAAQDRPGVALSPGAGGVDVALLGTGAGISGSGELARVAFRVKRAGDPRVTITSIAARDSRNRPVPVSGYSNGAGAAVRPGLAFAFPDPFRTATDIHFALRDNGSATLGVYDVAGRRVRLLLDGIQPAGAHTLAWDGRDDSGVRMAPGAYIVRLEAGGRSESRLVRLVR